MTAQLHRPGAPPITSRTLAMTLTVAVELGGLLHDVDNLPTRGYGAATDGDKVGERRGEVGSARGQPHACRSCPRLRVHARLGAQQAPRATACQQRPKQRREAPYKALPCPCHHPPSAPPCVAC